jgi:hypothetical protein
VSTPAEKLDHQQPVGEALRDVLIKIIDTGARHAELVVDLGDTLVKLHLTVVAVKLKPADGVSP